MIRFAISLACLAPLSSFASPLTTLPCPIEGMDTELLPYWEGEAEAPVWGFHDLDGQVRISPRFDAIDHFREGTAPARKDGLWGFVDIKGHFLIQPRWFKVQPFSEGLAPVQAEEGGPWGFIDPAAALVISAEHYSPRSFYEGLALTQDVDDGQRLIDATGAIVLDLAAMGMRIARQHRSDPGVLFIADSDGFGYIRTDGTPLMEGRRFADGEPMVDGVARVVLRVERREKEAYGGWGPAIWTEKVWGYVDIDGKELRGSGSPRSSTKSHSAPARCRAPTPVVENSVCVASGIERVNRVESDEGVWVDSSGVPLPVDDRGGIIGVPNPRQQGSSGIKKVHSQVFSEGYRVDGEWVIQWDRGQGEYSWTRCNPPP